MRAVAKDVTDEKALLVDQVASLQQQIGSERRDRSKWASARLRLLAQFCDEENKLSSALSHVTLEQLTGLEEEDGDEDDGGDDDGQDDDFGDGVYKEEGGGGTPRRNPYSPVTGPQRIRSTNATVYG